MSGHWIDWLYLIWQTKLNWLSLIVISDLRVEEKMNANNFYSQNLSTNSRKDLLDTLLHTSVNSYYWHSFHMYPNTACVLEKDRKDLQTADHPRKYYKEHTKTFSDTSAKENNFTNKTFSKTFPIKHDNQCTHGNVRLFIIDYVWVITHKNVMRRSFWSLFWCRKVPMVK